MSGGGYGSGPWGSGPWGSAPFESAEAGSVDVADSVSVADALDIDFPLRVESAIALTPFLVRIQFSAPLDPGYAPNFQVPSYSIAGLTISVVFPGPTSDTVLLTTSEQGPIVYTVVVSDAQSAAGDPIGVDNSANFAGFPVIPTFFATAQSRTKVQLTFSTAMFQNVEYTDPTSYTVTDMNGATVPIVSATAVGPSPNSRLALVLGAELDPLGYYVVNIISPAVVTVTLLNLDPPYDLFQWKESPRPITAAEIRIKIADFTGEVSGGLLGQPLGQIFFSPSLEASAPNSSIQIDDISLCTRAYDVYTPPGLPDPSPLYTFSTGGPSGTLGQSVLWAGFDRLLGAQINLSDHPEETLGPYTDGPATAILEEPLDQDYISLLNNSFWTLFDGIGTPFITANNLAPIPPGPTVGPIVLQP